MSAVNSETKEPGVSRKAMKRHSTTRELNEQYEGKAKNQPFKCQMGCEKAFASFSACLLYTSDAADE